MTALIAPRLSSPDRLRSAIDTACARIAPVWPLDRSIAVNPYWGLRDRSFEAADDHLRLQAGSRLTLDRDTYAALWRDGAIPQSALQAAAADAGWDEPLDRLISALEAPSEPLSMRWLPSEIDAEGQGTAADANAIRDSVTQQIGAYCASHYDRSEAEWQPPQRPGLYAGWRRALATDFSVATLLGRSRWRQRLHALPSEPLAAIDAAVESLGLPAAELPALFEAALLRIGGWAAWCAYRRWQARLEGHDDADIVDLLAIRLAWESLLDDGERGPDSRHQRWRQGWFTDAAGLSPTARRSARIDRIWQRAHELAYQLPLAAALSATVGADTPANGEVHAVFCIDVRSEVLRRAFEQALPGARTSGFAGFFGLPVRYTPFATTAARPQLPGLLAPALDLVDSPRDPADAAAVAAARTRRLSAAAGTGAADRGPSSSFSAVEAGGWLKIGSLIRNSIGWPRASSAPHLHGLQPAEQLRLAPRVQPGGSPDDALATRIELAAQALRGMGLQAPIAPMLVLVGHAGRSVNNPHAAALDCGACCGQSGELNARALAELLNDPDVQAALDARGLGWTPRHHAIAAVHETTTETVRLCPDATPPTALAPALARLEAAFSDACNAVLAERAGAAPSAAPRLRRAAERRSSDWAETRPEWALANNAAMVIAPRSRTASVTLDGRAFLHDYDCRQDPDGQALTQILTAPMVVASWINLQYHASTVDNRRYGSGNKILHNVVGGNIGVVEGQGGDLRVGLPLQSLHDGHRWRHTPLRLSVFVEAARQPLATIVSGHPLLRELVGNRWLYLFRLDPFTADVERFDGEQWLAVTNR